MNVFLLWYTRFLELQSVKTFLDYRPSEPTWIQFKFQKEEFDLDMLDALSRKNGGVITKEIIEKCKL